MFAGNFAPQGWALCNGQSLAISQNDALFTLLGTTYGGDGVNTFNLPDLRGRMPMHQGGNFVIGQSAGTETVTLTTQQLPAHTHQATAVTETGNQLAPAGNVWAASSLNQFSTSNPPPNAMNPGALATTGGSQPHDNVMPYLAVSFIIALQGIFPSRN